MPRNVNHAGRHRENRTPEHEKIGRTCMPLTEPPREERKGRSRSAESRTRHRQE